MRTLLAVSLVALSVACGSGGGSSSDGGSPGKDFQLIGSCTGAPGSDGSYNCVEEWAIPEPGLDLVAIWRGACDADDTNTFSSGRCGGNPNPGCCLHGSTDLQYRNCYYWTSGDPDGVCKAGCDYLHGTWE